MLAHRGLTMPPWGVPVRVARTTFWSSTPARRNFQRKALISLSAPRFLTALMSLRCGLRRDKAHCFMGMFPHPPRLEPDLRLSPHPAQHLGSFLHVIKTIKHLLHFRSRIHGRRECSLFLYSMNSLRVRVKLPHAPELPRLAGVYGGERARGIDPLEL